MPASDPKKPPGIFISYRRSDTPDAVGRIYDRLVVRVWQGAGVQGCGFDSAGAGFSRAPERHRRRLRGGAGDHRSEVDGHSQRGGPERLDDPDDFVRIELEAALARNVPVVPVLVGHAPMPGTSQLPSTLSSLAFRQSIEVRPDPDFHNDATRLVAALRQIIDPNAPGEDVSVTSPRKSRANRWLAWGLAAVATLAAIAFSIPAMKYLRLTPPPESRIAIALPVQTADPFSFSLSPDGRQIVYQASGDSELRLWLRDLSATTAQPLPGTEGAASPFWSPDGRSIGFFSFGSLKRLDLGGGQPQTLAPLKLARSTLNGVWGANGDILFSAGQGQPVFRIASAGGPVTEVTKTGASGLIQVPLSILPDGHHFLYLAAGGKADGIYLATLDGSPPVRLARDTGPATYLPSGWMLWLRLNGAQASGPLLAQRLDLRNARLTGAPVSLVAEVDAFSVTSTGLVAYRTVHSAGQQQLIWVDRSGKELGMIGDADGTLDSPRVAPDGLRVIVSRVRQGNRDLWLLDGVHDSRMTFNTAEDNYPAWSPDGLRVAFTSFRSGKIGLYEKLVTGAGGEEELLKAGNAGVVPSGWSADGRFLLFHEVSDIGSSFDSSINVLPIFGDRKPFVFLQTPFTEVWGQFSPDGRWVAYESNESGKYEVFVRPFQPPGTAGAAASNAAMAQQTVSSAGGVAPMWSADGKELYYLNPAGEMMAVPITVIGSAIAPGTPIKLFESHVWGGGIDNQTGRQYDVAPDGRFLINRVRKLDATPTITLLQNWNPEAKSQ